MTLGQTRPHRVGRAPAQAVLELALVAPLLIGLIVVIGQLTLLYLDYVSVIGVSRETARWLTTHPDKTDAQVQDHIAQIVPPNLLFSEFSFAGADPGWSPSCTSADQCSTLRQAGWTQYVHLRYTPDHHVFLRGPLNLLFFGGDPPTTLPTFEYSMMISQTALPPDRLQDTPTPTASPTPAGTLTPTPSPSATPTPSPTPQPTATATPGTISATGQDITPTEGISAPPWVVARFNGASVDPAYYVAVINWGDGTQSPGTLAYDSASAQMTVSGSHVFDDETDYQPAFTVSTTISDGRGNQASTSSSATVQDAQLTNGSIAVTPAQPVSGQPATLTATFTDTNPLADPSDFTTYIYWGNWDQGGTWEIWTGDSTPTATTADGVTFTSSHQHTYTESSGTYYIYFYLVDSSVYYFTWTTVTIAPPPLTATGTSFSTTEGQSFTATVATFVATDPRPVGDYTATIDWRDCSSCTPSTGNVTYDGPSNTYTVTGTHTYAEENTFNVAVAIANSSGDTASTTTSATIQDALLGGSGSDIAVRAGTPFSLPLATFTDALPNPPWRSDFSALVDWGDGSNPAPATIAPDGSGNFIVSGAYTYGGPGGTSYGLTITIQDVGGSSLVLHSTATVGLADVYATSPGRLDATEPSFSGQLASFQTTVPGPYTGTITWGDGTPQSTFTIADDGSGAYTVTNSHPYEEGDYPIAITITAPNGSSSSTNTMLTVSDARLHPRDPQNDVAASAMLSFTSVVAQFTDDNASAPSCNGGLLCDFTATIDWGDGASSPSDSYPVSIGGDSSTIFNASGTHTYAWGGSYQIVATISDQGGETTTVYSTAVVSGALRPTPTPTPTPTDLPTSTPTPLPSTPTPTPTTTPTPPATTTPGATPTETPVDTPTPTATPLPTQTPTPTPIPIGNRE